MYPKYGLNESDRERTDRYKIAGIGMYNLLQQCLCRFVNKNTFLAKH
jgi:hypothetical protein